MLATVPMWFGLLDEDKAGTMIAELAAPEHQTDWGMRIISSGAAKYSAGGYHFGSVWPLFTGWASVGEYRYHRALPGFHESDGECPTGARRLAGARHRGVVGRLLPAAVHEFSSPDLVCGHGNQSAAAGPVWAGSRRRRPPASLSRLMSLPTGPGSHSTICGWGRIRLRVAYRKSVSEITLEVTRRGNDDCSLEFSPALSLRAQVIGCRTERTASAIPDSITATWISMCPCNFRWAAEQTRCASVSGTILDLACPRLCLRWEAQARDYECCPSRGRLRTTP